MVTETPRISAISAVILCLGKIPPWPGLALRKLKLNHFDLWQLRLLSKLLFIKFSV